MSVLPIFFAAGALGHWPGIVNVDASQQQSLPSAPDQGPGTSRAIHGMNRNQRIPEESSNVHLARPW